MWYYECGGVISTFHSLDTTLEFLEGHRGAFNHLMPEHLRVSCKVFHTIVNDGKPCDWPRGCHIPLNNSITEFQKEMVSKLDAEVFFLRVGPYGRIVRTSTERR